MRNLFLYSLGFIVLATFMAISADYALAGGALDGKSYSVKIDDKGNKMDDELQFNDGMFFSTDCEQYGFGAASYTTTVEGDKTSFESTLTSEKEGTALWKGTVEGDNISGTFTWSKDDQEPAEYTFEGALKQ